MINDVRASVCKPRAKRHLSRYLGISSILKRTEFKGLMSGFAGLNDGMLGVDGREFGGVRSTRPVGFVLVH